SPLPSTSPFFPYTTLFRSRDQRDLLRRHQLLRVLLGLGGLALVVPEDHLDPPAEHAAFRVDLVDRHLDRLPVRSGERRADAAERDRKSTRLNSSHEWISYA